MKPKQIWDDTRGSVLVEFTVTLPLFLLLMFGLLQAGLLLYTKAGLQHGVEAAARCASLNYSAHQIGLNQSCFTVGGVPTPSTVIADTTYGYIKTYAAQHSWGVSPSLSSATFTVTTSTGCGTNLGYKVTASYPYHIMHFLFIGLTLSAQSCFPINIS
jgi:Flp pilus assembly protein TadG